MIDGTDSLGWRYEREPDTDSKDCRHLVTLVEDGMEWVGIRAWHSGESRWYNGNEPERAMVKAFMPLPATARRSWYRGKLLPESTSDTEGKQ